MEDFEVPTLKHSPWPTPSRAIYGFVLYISSFVLFGIYLIWALLPDYWLHKVGLTYLPARHWVITFPYLLFLCLPLVVFINFMRSTLLMPDLDGAINEPGEMEKNQMFDLEDLDSPVLQPSRLKSKSL